MPRSDRAGFTVVELMVAMTVGGMVILGGRLLVEQLARTAEDTVRAAASMDAVANAERMLRSLASRIEVGTDAAERFAGEPQETRFSSWCDVPGGWQERCTVTLALTRAGEGADSATMASLALVASLSTGERVTLRHDVRRGVIGYLNDGRTGGQWIRSWGASITAPRAVVVLMDLGTRLDTLVLRIGERG